MEPLQNEDKIYFNAGHLNMINEQPVIDFYFNNLNDEMVALGEDFRSATTSQKVIDISEKMNERIDECCKLSYNHTKANDYVREYNDAKSMYWSKLIALQKAERS